MNSKFSPSQFLSNSPVMKNKKLKEKIGLNMLSKYTGGKKNDVINLVSTDTVKDKNAISSSANAGPVRKNMQFLKNLEGNDVKPKLDKNKEFDENDPQFNFADARKYEPTGDVNKKMGISPEENEDEEEEVIKFEGYISKITETQKLKKLWFKLYDRDLFCKCLNVIILFYLSKYRL